MSTTPSPPGDGFFEAMFLGGGDADGDGRRASDGAASAGADMRGDVHRRGGTEGAPVPGDGRQVRCKLLRADGSEWTVTGLSLAPDGLRVDAYRYVSDGRTPADTLRQTLDDELLERDDRVWCLNRRGAVVWHLARPEDGSAPSLFRGGTGGDDG